MELVKVVLTLCNLCFLVTAVPYYFAPKPESEAVPEVETNVYSEVQINNIKVDGHTPFGLSPGYSRPFHTLYSKKLPQKLAEGVKDW